jgi:hypothetical protein
MSHTSDNAQEEVQHMNESRLYVSYLELRVYYLLIALLANGKFISI